MLQEERRQYVFLIIITICLLHYNYDSRFANPSCSMREALTAIIGMWSLRFDCFLSVVAITWTAPL